MATTCTNAPRVSEDCGKPIGEVDAFLRSRHAGSFARQYGRETLETIYNDDTSEFG